MDNVVVTELQQSFFDSDQVFYSILHFILEAMSSPRLLPLGIFSLKKLKISFLQMLISNCFGVQTCLVLVHLIY